MYSVYIYFDDDWSPYYVGKGGGDIKRARNKQAHETNQRTPVPVPPLDRIQVFYFNEEFLAFECEVQLISFWGRSCDAGCLINQCVGGPGTPGYKHTPDTIAKMSATHKGKVITQETRNKISRTLKGRPLAEETKRKMSASRLGKKRGPYKKK